MIYANQIKQQGERFKKGVPLNEMKKKLSLMDNEEAEKVKKITETTKQFLKNKDFEGAKKFLAHIKGQL